MRTECLLDIADPGEASVDVHARFLQVQLRSVDRMGSGGFEPVDELTVGPATWIRWHEAVEQSVCCADIAVGGSPSAAEARHLRIDIPGGEDIELLRDDRDRVIGRLVRTRSRLTGHLRVSLRSAGSGLTAVGVELENDTRWVPDPSGPDRARDVAARSSFVGSHLLLAATGAQFVSLDRPARSGS